MTNFFLMSLTLSIILPLTSSAEGCSELSLFQLHHMGERYATSAWVPKVRLSYRFSERTRHFPIDNGFQQDETALGEFDHTEGGISGGHRVMLMASWNLDRLLGFLSIDEEDWKHAQKYRSFVYDRDPSILNQPTSSLEKFWINEDTKNRFLTKAKSELKKSFLKANCKDL